MATVEATASSSSSSARAEVAISYSDIRGVARHGHAALRLQCERREYVLRLPNRAMRSQIVSLLTDVVEADLGGAAGRGGGVDGGGSGGRAASEARGGGGGGGGGGDPAADEGARTLIDTASVTIVGQPQPTAPAAAPAPAPSPGETPAAEAGGLTTTVSVPTDWEEGRTLTLKLSDGRQVIVEVPPGVGAGGSFACTLPAARPAEWRNTLERREHQQEKMPPQAQAAAPSPAPSPAAAPAAAPSPGGRKLSAKTKHFWEIQAEKEAAARAKAAMPPPSEPPQQPQPPSQPPPPPQQPTADAEATGSTAATSEEATTAGMATASPVPVARRSVTVEVIDTPDPPLGTPPPATPAPSTPDASTTAAESSGGTAGPPIVRGRSWKANAGGGADVAAAPIIPLPPRFDDLGAAAEAVEGGGAAARDDDAPAAQQRRSRSLSVKDLVASLNSEAERQQQQPPPPPRTASFQSQPPQALPKRGRAFMEGAHQARQRQSSTDPVDVNETLRHELTKNGVQ